MRFTVPGQAEAVDGIRRTRAAFLRRWRLEDQDPAAQIPVGETVAAAAARLAAGEDGDAVGSAPGYGKPAWFAVSAHEDGKFTVRVPNIDMPDYDRDPAAFDADCRTALARLDAGRNPVPYLHEKATALIADPDYPLARWFSVTIGFTLPAEDALTAAGQISQALYDDGIAASPYPHSILPDPGGSDYPFPRWTLARSAIGSEPDRAWDLASEPLSDTPETWQALDRICQVLRTRGAVTGYGDATLVRVAAADYAGRPAARGRLEGLASRYGNLLARYSANPYGGPYRRAARPGSIQCQGAVAGFRWDSSLDHAVIQGQANLSLALTATASGGGYELPPPGPGGPGEDPARSARELLPVLFGDRPRAAQAAALFAIAPRTPEDRIAGPAADRVIRRPRHPEDVITYHSAQEIVWNAEAARAESRNDPDGAQFARGHAAAHAAHARTVRDAAPRTFSKLAGPDILPAREQDRALTRIPHAMRIPQVPGPAPGSAARRPSPGRRYVPQRDGPAAGQRQGTGTRTSPGR